MSWIWLACRRNAGPVPGPGSTIETVFGSGGVTELSQLHDVLFLLETLMENVPDTRYVQDLLPEFKAKTGIDVEIEAISYIDMHSKLVPQLSSPEGSYDAIVVDFYWVAEFTKAGWLMPLDDLIK